MDVRDSGVLEIRQGTGLVLVRQNVHVCYAQAANWLIRAIEHSPPPPYVRERLGSCTHCLVVHVLEGVCLKGLLKTGTIVLWDQPATLRTVATYRLVTNTDACNTGCLYRAGCDPVCHQRKRQFAVAGFQNSVKCQPCCELPRLTVARAICADIRIESYAMRFGLSQKVISSFETDPVVRKPDIRRRRHSPDSTHNWKLIAAVPDEWK
jgi:hypothetical protein